MNAVHPSGHSTASVAQPPRRRAENIKFAWARGAEPDTRAALAGDPDLLADKSIVLDLAYEEYCLRRDAGEDPDLDDFCNGFPPYRSSLRRLLAAHQFLAERPELLDRAVPVHWPKAGESFGDYTLLRELGRGSFARVFLATEASTGDRLVAVKLSVEGASEAKTLGRLDHPNIVPILSARQDDSGLSVVCMPYLGSATLHDVLDQAFPEQDSRPPTQAGAILDALRNVMISEPPAPDRPVDAVLRKGSYVDGVIHLGLQMANALAFIHARGIYHRDFKPSNILLDPSGRPLLLDFNLSSDKRLCSSRAGGTLPYMAPEQVRQFVLEGESAVRSEPDGRADIFSLGVVLYELLTGKNPFGPLPHGLSPAELAQALVAQQEAGCRPLRDFNPAVPVYLAQMIEKCLAPAPEDRPADPALVANEFRRHFSPSARLRRWARRRPKFLGALACVIVLTISAGAWSAATLPPRLDRAYGDGRDAYLAGKYDKAVGHFTRALNVDVNHHPSCLGLGRALIAQGKPMAALPYFTQADRLRPGDGQTLALYAYCHGLINYPGAAEQFSSLACKAGYTTAAVLSNRAYARMQLGSDKLADAEADIREALRLEPNLVAGRLNRAHLAFLHGTHLNEQDIEDVQYALKHAEPSAKLHTDAAHYFAAAATRPNDRYADQAVKCIRLAIGLGANPDVFKTDAVLTPKLAGHREFAEALKAVPGDESKSNDPHLTEPVEGFRN